MVLLQEYIMEIQLKRLIKKKVELSLCKMEEELRKELENKDSDQIEIKFGEDKELCKYVIKINDKQIYFTLDDIAKALKESNKDSIENTNDNKINSIIKYPLAENI